ncbi:MAG: hypothetical protein ACP5LS_05805 [Thermoprotei archaeon]
MTGRHLASILLTLICFAGALPDFSYAYQSFTSYSGSVTALSIYPYEVNGQYIIGAGLDLNGSNYAAILSWSPTGGPKQLALVKEPQEVESIAVSPSYVLVGTGSYSGPGEVSLYSLNGTLLWTYTFPYWWIIGVSTVAISANQDLFAIGTSAPAGEPYGLVSVYRISGINHVSEAWNFTYGTNQYLGVHQVLFSPNGNYLLMLAGNGFATGGYVILFNASTGQMKWDITNLADPWDASFSPDSNYIVVGASNTYVSGGHNIAYLIGIGENVVWSYDTGPNSPTNWAEWVSTDYEASKTCVAGNGNLYFINSSGSVTWQTPIGFGSSEVAESSDGSLVVVAGIGGESVLAYDGTSLLINFTAQAPITSMVMSEDGKLVVVGTKGGISIIPLSTQTSSLSQAYTVTFTESGLPPGTTWSVTLDGKTESSSTPRITFSVPAGSYSYYVSSISGYSTSPSSGSMYVNGNLSISVVFSQVVYPVTFSEIGLPSGAAWSVTLDGVTHSSEFSQIAFDVPSGTYSYSVSSPPGFEAFPSSGALTVVDSGVSEVISFSQVTYPVAFTESGLPPGTTWSVTLDGKTLSSTTSQITFEEPVGTYQFAVVSPVGYSASLKSGELTVQGPVIQNISFVELPPQFSIAPLESSLTVSAGGMVNDTILVSGTSSEFPVSLSLSGLPPGFSYSLSPGTSAAPFSSLLTIAAPSYAEPGTYSFQVVGSCQGNTESAVISLKVTGPVSYQQVNSVTASSPTTYTVEIGVSSPPNGGEAYAKWGLFDSQRSQVTTSSSGPVEVYLQKGESITLVAQSLTSTSGFKYWKTSGQVYVADPNSSTTTATVEGNGMVTAIFIPLHSYPSPFLIVTPTIASGAGGGGGGSSGTSSTKVTSSRSPSVTSSYLLVGSAEMIQVTSKDSAYYNFTLLIQLSSPNGVLFFNKTEENDIVDQVENSLNAEGYNLHYSHVAAFQAKQGQDSSYFLKALNALFGLPSLVSSFEEGGILYMTAHAANEIVKGELGLSPTSIAYRVASGVINSVNAQCLSLLTEPSFGLGTTNSGSFKPFYPDAIVSGSDVLEIVISNVLVPKGEGYSSLNLNAQYLEIPGYSYWNLSQACANIASLSGTVASQLSSFSLQEFVVSQSLTIHVNVQWQSWFNEIIQRLFGWVTSLI